MTSTESNIYTFNWIGDHINNLYIFNALIVLYIEITNITLQNSSNLLFSFNDYFSYINLQTLILNNI